MNCTRGNFPLPAVLRRPMWLFRCGAFLAVLLVSLSAHGAISWVGSGATASSTGSNNRGLVIPAIANNDVLVAHVAVRGNRTITAPAGWTLIDQVYVSGSKITQGIYYRVGLSTDGGTTATWTFSATDDNAGVIRAYRGVDTVTPIGNADGNTGDDNDLVAPSISTTAANEWLLAFYSSADGRSTPFTTPSGMTERYDFDNGGDNNGLALAGDDEVRATAGATGSRTSRADRTDDYVAQLIALKPPPTVLSIARADANPSGAASVSWTVTFSSNVSGVNSNNFALINSGLGGSPAITSVTGGGSTWTVTASTGTGTGTLGLNMVNTTGTNPSVTGLPFTGEVYTILPAVTAITRADADPTGASSVSWTVTFSSSVSGVSSGNFALANTGLGGTPAITSVTGSGTTWTVTASTGSGSGTLGLNMTGSGGVTPGIAGLPFTGEVYTVQRPTVTSFTLASTDPTTANTAVAWTIVFSATVTGVDATDFVLVEAGGVTGSSITTVTGSGTTWTVTADTGTSDTGTLGLNLVDDDSIVNGVGTPLGGTGIGNGDYTGPYYTLEPPAPNLAKTASAAAAVVGDVVTFTITATNPYASPLANVVLTDTLPAGMSYVTHVATLGSVSIAGQIVTWTIPTLPALASAQMTLAVSLSQQGPLTNTVTAPGATPASASILVLASAVTHFRMDEPVASWTGAAGEVIDSGGTALHGRRLTSTSPTTTNVVDPNPTIISQHPSVIGGFCNAAYFDRRAIVEVADSPRFDYTTQLSASAWIYPTAYPSGSSDLYSILSNDVNYEFHINPSGKLFWWWNASTLTSATTIPLNQWTHVAITFDSSAGVRRQRIYINGVLDGNTNNWQGTLQPNNCNFYIGGDIATGASCSILPARNFQGMIDEVKLYSFELSAPEVIADMTLGRSCSGTFDHVRIEHDGTGSICAPERVTVKACLDSDCTTLYPGNVTVNLAPTGWVGGSTFSFSGGIASRQLSRSSAGSVTLGTNSVLPTPAAATRCFNGATETCVMTFASASCAFDAVEQDANPQTPIFTKLAGTNFNIDVLALLDATTINSSYTGPVAVDLVDTSSSACPTGAGLNTATNITFAAGDAGRKTVTFNYPGAARNVRVRAVVGASAPACSTDNFAIRPTGFTVTSSDATNNAASGTPVIKAGTAFNLAAAAIAGYNGTPLIDNTKVSGTPVAGAIGGSFAAAAAATGIAGGNSFTYSEVGNFGLAQNAVYDATFTTVDQPDDCTAGFSNTLSGGKYGCSFGSAAVTQTAGSSGFGRFIPARFNVSANTPLFNPACGAFTYLGEPLPYLTAPALTVTALNAGGVVTNNYGGAYWKLAPALGGRSYTDNSGTTSTLSVATAGTLTWTDTANSDGDGVVTLTGESLDYSKPAAPIAPFAANVDLNFSAAFLTDGDAVCYDPENDATCNTYSIASIAGTELRWGRVRLGNAHGSELIDLNVPLVAEHFDGTSFVTNAADTCTAGVTLGVADVDATDGLTPADVCAWDIGAPGDSGIGCAAAGAPNLQYQAPPDLVGQEGSFNLWLQAPGAGNTGSVDITATVPAWLQFDWTGAGNSNPTARITFGIFGGSPRHIYLRERY